MAKIALLTLAYNAEKTLRRAIDSVLSQDMRDFTYYLVENGSSDQTRAIIEEYSKKDARIVPFYFDQNYIYRAFDFLKYISDGKKEKYVAVLDSDDEYTPAAFGKLLKFAEDNSLGFAAGGNSFIDATTEKNVGVRGIQSDLVIDQNNFDTIPLGIYHAIVRPIWSKLFRLDIMAKFEWEFFYDVRYGADTMFCLEMIKRCTRFGFLSGVHYNYYVSSSSDSYRWDNKRFENDCAMDDYTRNFLLENIGVVSPENHYFLSLVYESAIADTLKILLKSRITHQEKMRFVMDLVSHEKTQLLFLLNGAHKLSVDTEIRQPITLWLMSQPECRKPGVAEIAAKIFLSMYLDLSQLIQQDCLAYLILWMPEAVDYLLKKENQRLLERLQIWIKRHDEDNVLLTELQLTLYQTLNKSDSQLFELLLEIKKKRPKCAKILNIDGRMSITFKKYPLLTNMNIFLATRFPRIVLLIMEGDFQRALEGFLSASQNLEIPDDAVEEFLLFAQNLSAIAENMDAYICFKKLWFEYLLTVSRSDEVRDEINEFADLFPNDEALKAMQDQLTSYICS